MCHLLIVLLYHRLYLWKTFWVENEKISKKGIDIRGILAYNRDVKKGHNMNYKPITHATNFKIEWAEGRTKETEKYVGRELTLNQFIYIITRRHHQIALDLIDDPYGSSYGCYDKHKVWIDYNGDGNWEVLGRFDLGNDDDWEYIRKNLNEAFDAPMSLRTHTTECWSDLVAKGREEEEWLNGKEA